MGDIRFVGTTDAVIYSCPEGFRAVLRNVIYEISSQTGQLYLIIRHQVGVDRSVLTALSATPGSVYVETRVVLHQGDQLRVFSSGATGSVVCTGYELTEGV